MYNLKMQFRRSIIIVGLILFLMIQTNPFTTTGSAHDNKTTLTSGSDSPVITSFKMSPRKLKKNRISLIKLEFKFTDVNKDLLGGKLFVYAAKFDDRYGEYIASMPLKHKVFRKRKGKFELSFGVLCEDWSTLTYQIWLEDANGNESNKPEYILKARKKSSGEKQGNELGKPAWDFTLLDKSGKKVRLSSFRGKVVLIDFSAAWCGPCVTMATEMERLYKKYKGQGFRTLTLLYDGVDQSTATLKDAQDYAKKHNLTYPILVDTLDGVHYNYLDHGWAPAHLIIDKKGVLRWNDYGFTASKAQQIEQMIIDLLAE